MCSHYQGLTVRENYVRRFGVTPPPEGARLDVWPGYLSSFIRRQPQAEGHSADLGHVQALNGLFGLVPHWATDTQITKSTYNCRSETAAQKPSFRDAFRNQQRCIVPAEAIYEPDWQSGRAVATRIESRDGHALAMAGLWSSWRGTGGVLVHSFTLLTVNADAHSLMARLHKPTDEKRMVVLLAPEQWADWLDPHNDAMAFMRPYPADALQTVAPTQRQSDLFC